MSAFIVSEKTMHRAVEALLKPGASCEEGNVLGRQLYALNQQAVIARYGDKASEDAGSLPKTYCWQRPLCGRMQHFKSLRCLIYQCSEGNLSETSPLYKQIDEASIELGFRIVCDLPEYDRCDWD